MSSSLNSFPSKPSKEMPGRTDSWFSKAELEVKRPRTIVGRMRGGSQSFAVCGEDRQLYVLKLNGNPQGPNLLANEYLGARLLAALGFRVPQLCAFYISESFLADNPDLYFETSTGRAVPQSGYHLGSRFVASMGQAKRLAGLPSTAVRSIGIPFVGTRLFDLWADHSDTRQLLRVRGRNEFAPQWVHTDNGHLFGGAGWAFRSRAESGTSADPSMLRGVFPWEQSTIERWLLTLAKVLPEALDRAVSTIPRSWYSGNVKDLHEFFGKRSRDLGTC